MCDLGMPCGNPNCEFEPKEKTMSDEGHKVYEGTNTIVRGDEEAAIVFKNDGTMDIYMPDFKADDDREATAALIATAVAAMVVHGDEALHFWVDRVSEECKELEKEGVSSDTDDSLDKILTSMGDTPEDTNDTVPQD